MRFSWNMEIWNFCKLAFYEIVYFSMDFILKWCQLETDEMSWLYSNGILALECKNLVQIFKISFCLIVRPIFSLALFAAPDYNIRKWLGCRQGYPYSIIMVIVCFHRKKHPPNIFLKYTNDTEWWPTPYFLCTWWWSNERNYY